MQPSTTAQKQDKPEDKADKKEKKPDEPYTPLVTKFNYYAIYGTTMGELVAAKSQLATEFNHTLI